MNTSDVLEIYEMLLLNIEVLLKTEFLFDSNDLGSYAPINRVQIHYAGFWIVGMVLFVACVLGSILCKCLWCHNHHNDHVDSNSDDAELELDDEEDEEEEEQKQEQPLPPIAVQTPPAQHPLLSFTVVVAMGPDRGIGFEGGIPWQGFARDDMSHFIKLTRTTQDSTKENVVIMGRRTLESMSSGGLPRRINIVVSRTLFEATNSATPPEMKGVIAVPSLDHALRLVSAPNFLHKVERVFVIGGQQLYAEAMMSPQCEAIVQSQIRCAKHVARNNPWEFDCYFPWIPSRWFQLDISTQTAWTPDSYSGTPWRVRHWVRVERPVAILSPVARAVQRLEAMTEQSEAAEVVKAASSNLATLPDFTLVAVHRCDGQIDTALSRLVLDKFIGEWRERFPSIIVTHEDALPARAAAAAGSSSSSSADGNGNQFFLLPLRTETFHQARTLPQCKYVMSIECEMILPQPSSTSSSASAASSSESASSVKTSMITKVKDTLTESLWECYRRITATATTPMADASPRSPSSATTDHLVSESGEYIELRTTVYERCGPNLEEQQYLDMVKRIIETGYLRGDRTGTGTLSLFGNMMRFSLRGGRIPLLTTKRVFWRGVVEELLWMLKGKTDSKLLALKRVFIWDANGSRQALDKLGLHENEVGDLGPIYGFQWRHYGATYNTCNMDYTGQGIDQIAALIANIKKNPSDRRLILMAWNPVDLPKMALPPCHVLCQFYVGGTNNDELSCMMYQRSVDTALGWPFNVAFYSTLCCMIARVCGLKPGEFIHIMGDTHVYTNHVEPLKEQLNRTPRSFPTLHIKRQVTEIDDFTFEDFELQDYHPYDAVKMKMAV